MSGHSKWSKVKRMKGALDVKRGKIFAKLSKEITISTKLCGGDPHMNPRLRMVLLKCRSANMPADNIERAIKRGTGGGEIVHYEDLVYEAFGPHGVAILMEISTDNRHRTAADVRHILARNDGTIATSGAVSRLFHRKGQIIVSREGVNEDQLMEVALEAGAEDFKSEPESFEIITDPAHFEAVNRKVEEKGIKPVSTELTYIPGITVRLSDAEAIADVHKLIEALEDHDDVKEVYSNAEFQET